MIEVYPKVFKVYSKMKNNRLDYTSEQSCEVSKEMSISQLIGKLFSLPLNDVSGGKTVFFKALSMGKWQEIKDLTYKASELSSECIIFMAVFSKEEEEIFRRHHISPQTGDLSALNIGD